MLHTGAKAAITGNKERQKLSDWVDAYPGHVRARATPGRGGLVMMNCLWGPLARCPVLRLELRVRSCFGRRGAPGGLLIWSGVAGLQTMAD